MWSLYNKFFQRRGWHSISAEHVGYTPPTCVEHAHQHPYLGVSAPLSSACACVCECDGGQAQAWDKDLHEFPFIDPEALRPDYFLQTRS